MKTPTADPAEKYLTLPYSRELVPEDDGTWYARIVELSGCMTVGDTPEEALANLDDAMASWIEAKLEAQEEIPEPLASSDFSGKFLVRIPKSLHREVKKAADRDGVSLNQLVTMALARLVGAPTSSR
ncbi:MAG: type II toxin-antitoxin system HicB family antitoxin [Candidatus Eremiobacteraeota bacterium]|nr:type II toxin-antitoxin system HicB family antitoxin [Candidatus Eremiobacteraeota bacterium]